MSASQIIADSNLKDVFLELANIGIGRAASTMSELTGRNVEISVPEIEVLSSDSFEDIRSTGDGTVAYVTQGFNQELNGRAFILLSRAAAIHLAELLFGEEEVGGRFDESEQNSILELGNIMIGGIMGTLCNEFGTQIGYDVPELQLKGMDELIHFINPESSFAFSIKATLSIGVENVNSYVLLLFDQETNQNLVEKLESLIND